MLLPDPIPVRYGKYEPGMLTKGEMQEVFGVLDACRQPKVRKWSPEEGQNRWVAFVSLLHAGYIREREKTGNVYVLTQLGTTYFNQLTEGK